MLMLMVIIMMVVLIVIMIIGVIIILLLLLLLLRLLLLLLLLRFLDLGLTASGVLRRSLSCIIICGVVHPGFDSVVNDVPCITLPNSN